MTDSKTKNIYLTTNLQPVKVEKKKKSVRVQYVNEDLNLAIKQMKQSVKNKSSLHQLTNPIKEHEQLHLNPQISEKNQDQHNKNDADRLFYTETYKKKVEARLHELEERKKQINGKSLQKQIKARLLRKIQENIQLKQKMDILKDVQQRRQLLIIDKNQRQKRKKQQQKLIHQSSIANAEMLRKIKKKNLNKELKDSRCVEQQSLKNLHFKNFMSQKSKQQKRMQLVFRHQFIIRNKSAKGLRDELISSRTYRGSTVNLSRPIKTSHLSRRSQIKSQYQEQQLIIQQYRQKPTDKDIKPSQNQQKVQKKYNSLVRQAQKSSNDDQTQRQSKIGSQQEGIKIEIQPKQK